MWSILVDLCTISYLAMVVVMLIVTIPLWSFSLFVLFMIVGAYAEHRADYACAAARKHP